MKKCLFFLFFYIYFYRIYMELVNQFWGFSQDFFMYLRILS
jgi:hypothetical protein